jgi:hypothetical protein
MKTTLTRRNTLSLAGAAGAYSLLGSLGCDDAAGRDGSGGGAPGQGGGPGATGPGGTAGSTGPGGSNGSGTSATTGAGGGSGGSCVPAMEAFVGSYAALNLADHPIYSIDMALEDYPRWNAQGSGEVSEHEVGIWWDGGDALRTHPPTAEQSGSGIGALSNLWRNATLEIRELNLRFEFQAGPEYCSRTNGNLPKFVIAHSTTSMRMSADPVARPMLYWREVTTADNPMFNRPDTLAICPAQGTWQSWSETEYAEDGTAWPMQFQPVYWADAADTFGGAPVLDATEIVTIEMRMISIATAEYPRGLIAVRAYRRNGDVFERGMPWDRDPNHAVGISYIQEIQMFGGGYYNNANALHENNYTRIGGHITLARSCGGWLGPRAGFVRV